MLLAGDIGGTRTRLALYDESTGALRRAAWTQYESRSASTLEEIVIRFLKESGNPETAAACFGVAGAVVGGQVRATNLPWRVSEAGLAERWLMMAMDGKTPLEQIAVKASEQFPHTFSRPEDAFRRAGELSDRYSR